MEKLLCIEDSQEFQILIGQALKGFEIDFASTLEQARSLLDQKKKSYHLMLLDLSLPDGNGMKFISEINLRFPDKKTPIFIVSADSDVYSKIAAFGVGIDDYIVKPFSSLELRARVEAKLKKSQRSFQEESVLQIGDLTIDTAKMVVSRNEKKINLTPLEFKILVVLTRRKDFVFSRTQIMNDVWGDETYITDRTVDAHISHLRKKISRSNVQIESVLSVGYKLHLAGEA
ncbi:MAG: response regulator transcription factor [Pseudobdellovibrionaceae bacterium]